MKIKVFFLLPYPLHQAPSQRFRVEAFFSLFEDKKINYRTHEFFDQKAWNILYKEGSILQKGWAVVKGFIKRFWIVLMEAPKWEYIFIHREAAPLGPPVFEWLLTKVFRKKIIYDFDDAIWIPNVTKSNRIATAVKCFWKIKYICKWSYKISAGNDFLARYASNYNKAVQVIPTCVDTKNRYVPVGPQHQHPVTIGWTGSHSTLQFFEIAFSVLKKLEEKLTFRLLVICDKRPELDIKSMEFLPWNRETEIEDLANFNIGIMPLREDAWSEGKCGFKIIQYMALGIPAVASPVGVNKKIIDHGQNGYICSNEEEWITCLTELLHDAEKRRLFGTRGRKKIEEEYSIHANASKFLALFK